MAQTLDFDQIGFDPDPRNPRVAEARTRLRDL